METHTKDKIAQYLEALRRSKSDNEKFAALMMISKVAKETGLSGGVKKQILEASGDKFFTRLLKTKTQPEGCPDTMYKMVALSILSVLCTEPEVACSPALTDNLPIFNTILETDPGEEDVEGRQVVDDTLDCFYSLCQTIQGLQMVVEANSVTALCTAVTSQSYGQEKAQELIFTAVSRLGYRTWGGSEEAFHSLISYIGDRFCDDQSETKFYLCNTLVFLLQSTPRNLDRSTEPPWLRKIMTGLDGLLKSKLSIEHRERALCLMSVLVEVCGTYCMLPPYTDDTKLFLLTTHLCCVEVRMTLEDTDLTKVMEHGRILTSCYSYLEQVINHLTTGPALQLDDRQVIQLHSAMVGAFSAVLHFLKRVALNPTTEWNSIVLATVRVLAAWMVEETSALKEEVYELLPFLMQLSKMSLPMNSEKSDDKDESTNNCDKDNAAENNSDRLDKESIEKSAKTPDSVTKTDDQSSDEMTSANQSDKCGSESDALNDGMAQVSVDDRGADDTGEEVLGEDGNKCDSNASPESHRLGSGSKLSSCQESDIVTEKGDQSGIVDEKGNQPNVSVTEKGDQISDNISDDQSKSDKSSWSGDVSRYEQAPPGKEHLGESELKAMHVSVDILHVLLPGLSHLTAEDLPRQILLRCGALSILDLYIWRQWEKYLRCPEDRETQSSIVILCNIFLNLVIVEPAIVTGNREFAHVLLLVIKGIHVVEQDSRFVEIWAHLVTLGLMLLRALCKTAEEFLEADSLSRFFTSSVRFLSGAYVITRDKKDVVLDIADIYKPSWDHISQTWFLSVQALCACIPLFPNITSIILQADWLPDLLTTLKEVKGNNMAEEMRSCFLLLLATIAKGDKEAKNVIKEKGGMGIARTYKSEELAIILKSSK